MGGRFCSELGETRFTMAKNMASHKSGSPKQHPCRRVFRSRTRLAWGLDDGCECVLTMGRLDGFSGGRQQVLVRAGVALSCRKTGLLAASTGHRQDTDRLCEVKLAMA